MVAVGDRVRIAGSTQSVEEFLGKLDGDSSDTGWRVPPAASFEYELNMLSLTREALELQQQPHVRVALVEAFLLHARNLFEFFFPEANKRGNRKDDVTAKSLVAGWTKTRSDMPSDVAGLVRAMNKTLSHVTASRPTVNVRWDFEDIHTRILALAEELKEIADRPTSEQPPPKLAGQPARVVVRERQGKIVIEGARDLRDRIGHDLFAAFLKCFGGIDRLLALEQILFFTQTQQDHKLHSYVRNLRLIVTTLSSTMYETAKALQELRDACVKDKLQDKSLWDPVDKLRAKWQGDPRVAKMRNKLGFHLGEIELYEKGLEFLLQDSDEHIFEALDGTKRHEGETRLPVEALLAALKIDKADLDAVLKMTWEAHSTLPELLNRVWGDVLRSAGVSLEREE
jgi:hypothetical protein